MLLKKRPKHILALDAGVSSCGAVVFKKGRVVRYVCLTTTKRENEPLALGNARRCREIATQLKKLCQDFPVKAVCVELPHGGARSAKAMSYMSMATATIAVFCAMLGVEMFSITPNEIKRLVKSKGSVSKEMVARYVEENLKIEFPSKWAVREHICDAAAAYLVAQKKFSPKFL